MAQIRGGFNYPGLPSETWTAQTPTGTIFEAFKHIDRRITNMLIHGMYAMNKTAGELANLGKLKVQELISQPGSYLPYYKDGQLRMSSHPGKPPAASRGGSLDSSIYSVRTSKDKDNPAVAEFGSTAPYARELEFGTTSIQPRPFLLPARQAVADVAQAIVVRNLVIAYNKSLRNAKNTTVDVRMEI